MESVIRFSFDLNKTLLNRFLEVERKFSMMLQSGSLPIITKAILFPFAFSRVLFSCSILYSDIKILVQ